MKDFAKSVRTNNADLGLRPVVPQLVKDIGKIYEANGKDREKTKQELIQKHHMSERQAEDVLRQIVGNSKVGNYILSLMDQANEYSKGFSEALKKGDKAEAEKVSGYAKILKRQIKEERDEIQKRLKELDNAERIMGSVGNSKPKVGNETKTYSGKYLDIYDNGTVVVKEGWAFGEKFNKSNFESWINQEIQSKEKTLKECKMMKDEFSKSHI